MNKKIKSFFLPFFLTATSVSSLLIGGLVNVNKSNLKVSSNESISTNTIKESYVDPKASPNEEKWIRDKFNAGDMFDHNKNGDTIRKFRFGNIPLYLDDDSPKDVVEGVKRAIAQFNKTNFIRFELRRTSLNTPFHFIENGAITIALDYTMAPDEALGDASSMQLNGASYFLRGNGTLFNNAAAVALDGNIYESIPEWRRIDQITETTLHELQHVLGLDKHFDDFEYKYPGAHFAHHLYESPSDLNNQTLSKIIDTHKYMLELNPLEVDILNQMYPAPNLPPFDQIPKGFLNAAEELDRIYFSAERQRVFRPRLNVEQYKKIKKLLQNVTSAQFDLGAVTREILNIIGFEFDPAIIFRGGIVNAGFTENAMVTGTNQFATRFNAGMLGNFGMTFVWGVENNGVTYTTRVTVPLAFGFNPVDEGISSESGQLQGTCQANSINVTSRSSVPGMYAENGRNPAFDLYNCLNGDNIIVTQTMLNKFLLDFNRTPVKYDGKETNIKALQTILKNHLPPVMLQRLRQKFLGVRKRAAKVNVATGHNVSNSDKFKVTFWYGKPFLYQISFYLVTVDGKIDGYEEEPGEEIITPTKPTVVTDTTLEDIVKVINEKIKQKPSHFSEHPAYTKQKGWTDIQNGRGTPEELIKKFIEMFKGDISGLPPQLKDVKIVSATDEYNHYTKNWEYTLNISYRGKEATIIKEVRHP